MQPEAQGEPVPRTTMKSNSHQCFTKHLPSAWPGYGWGTIIDAIGEEDSVDQFYLEQLSSHPSMHILSILTHCQPRRTFAAALDNKYGV